MEENVKLDLWSRQLMRSQSIEHEKRWHSQTHLIYNSPVPRASKFFFYFLFSIHKQQWNICKIYFKYMSRVWHTYKIHIIYKRYLFIVCMLPVHTIFFIWGFVLKRRNDVRCSPLEAALSNFFPAFLSGQKQKL